MMMKYFPARILARYQNGIDPDSTVKCVVVNHYLHNDVEVRCRIAVSPDTVINVVVPISVFNGLPEEEIKE